MEFHTWRHPQCRNGKPTPEDTQVLLAKVAPVIDGHNKKKVLVVSTGVDRTDFSAQDIADEFQFRSPLVIPQLGPLRTANFPPIFGGRFFDALQKTHGLDRLILYLWATSEGLFFPVFTETPARFCARIRTGLRVLRGLAGDTTLVIGVVNRETIAGIEAKTKKKSLSMALKKEVKHLDTFVFRL